MITQRINGNVVELFDSVDNMPAINFQEFNTGIVIDAGIGSDAESIERHITEIARFIQADDKENALKQLSNYHNCLHLIVNKVSPKYRAFAACVASINGELFPHFEDSKIEKVQDLVNKTGITYGKIKALIGQVKKNLMMKLSFIFPVWFKPRT